MSALEDAKLEKTRDMLGALAVLTETSGPINHQRFVPHFIGAIESLRKMRYVKDSRHKNHSVPGSTRYTDAYELTDAGWEYARKTLETIGKIL